MEIGKRIKELRKAAGMTQKELADKVGCSRCNISKLESGKVDATYAMIGRISDALGVTVANLCDNAPVGHCIERPCNDVVSVREITEYCEKVVETLRKMQEKCLNRTTESDLAAYAWFCQQERIYDYEIPNAIRAILKERNAEKEKEENNG